MKSKIYFTLIALIVSSTLISCAKKNEKPGSQDTPDTSISQKPEAKSASNDGSQNTDSVAVTNPEKIEASKPATAAEVIRQMEDHRKAEQELSQQLQELKNSELQARRNAFAVRVKSELTEIARALGLRNIEIGSVKFPSTGRAQLSAFQKIEIYERVVLKRIQALNNVIAHDNEESNSTKGALKFQIQENVVSNIVFGEKFKSAVTNESGIRTMLIDSNVDHTYWRTKFTNTVTASRMSSAEAVDLFILTNAAADKAKLEADLGGKIAYDSKFKFTKPRDANAELRGAFIAGAFGANPYLPSSTLDLDRNKIRYPQQQIKKLTKVLNSNPSLVTKIIQLRPSLIQLSNNEQLCSGGYDPKTGILVLPIGESFTKEMIEAKIN